MKKSNFFAELVRRITLPSPSFFVKIQWFSGILTALGVGLSQLSGQFPDIGWMQWLAGYSGHLTAAGALALLISSLTAKPEVPNSNL